MGLFGDKSKPDGLRTVAMVQADPEFGAGFVLVPDDRQGEYEAKGYTFVEDLAGEMCLMKLKA